MEEQKENIKVIVRFRPLLERESKQMDYQIENNSIVLTENKSTHLFTFDTVFASHATQEEIFQKVAHDAVIWVTQGYNTTIFAYGPTSSGKTYCMFGTKEKQGIIPRVCNFLFDLVESNENVKYAQVKCSFLEIYMENIRDLLKNNKINLKIRQDRIRGIYVESLYEEDAETPEQVLKIIETGMENRMKASTSLNNISSRSHSVFTISLSQEMNDGIHFYSKIHLVDLAGSENVGKSEVSGTNLVEAQKINKSLSCLANVIYALTEQKRTHIPYRDSKLTYLLQDSMGGKSKTILIITASPSADSYFETLNSLKFGKRAKNIKNSPRVNRTESFGNLKVIIEELKNKLEDITEKYIETQKVIAGTTTEVEMYKNRCEKLEKKLDIYFHSINEKNDIEKDFQELVAKERDYSESIIETLETEQAENCRLKLMLNTFEKFFETLSLTTSDIERGILIKNFKMSNFSESF